MANSESILTMQDLTFCYDGHSAAPVLQDINLNIASGQRVGLVDVDVQQIVLHVLKKDVPPVARLDNGAAAVAGKEQYPHIGAVGLHVLQHLIHVSLKIAQMIFLILRLAYNVLKGIDTGDMVQRGYAEVLALAFAVLILVVQILIDVGQQLRVLQELLPLTGQGDAPAGPLEKHHVVLSFQVLDGFGQAGLRNKQSLGSLADGTGLADGPHI